MKTLKQSVFEYISFMDMDIDKANAAKQRDKFEFLSAKMVQTLKLHSLNISSDFKATLKIIHSKISSLLAKNVELKAKSAQYLHDVSEKESLLQEIDKTKVELNKISSKVMVEDSLMISLALEIKELQAKMNHCKARLAAEA
ncbi:unnamed protein product [Fraxinus pennsylvanica]|uniref:Uncharacterized protein n=1 Tax=Fraxinus pennsylvanica TaxID=56036 RepID=A0AAD2E3B3_9LAMI|nr:unnamed protein product [Fraxinus pennsylvanica]